MSPTNEIWSRDGSFIVCRIDDLENHVPRGVPGIFVLLKRTQGSEDVIHVNCTDDLSQVPKGNSWHIFNAHPTHVAYRMDPTTGIPKVDEDRYTQRLIEAGELKNRLNPAIQ